MKFQIVLIDPQKAETWLKQGGKNRKLSPRHVDRLAAEMAAGRWVLNGEAIIFSADGKLVDGQHRLHAVIKSRTSIMSVVIFGVEDERAFETIDHLIRVRGVDQILEMDGMKNAALKAAVARRLIVWESYEDKRRFTLVGAIASRLPGHDIMEYARSHETEIEYMYGETRASLPYKRCGAPSAFITALLICNRTDEVATMLFTEAIKTGLNLTQTSPVHLLRERLIFPPERRRGEIWDTEVMALTIKSWNYFVLNKSMRTLRWRQEGDKPEGFPIPKGESK